MTDARYAEDDEHGPPEDGKRHGLRPRLLYLSAPWRSRAGKADLDRQSQPRGFQNPPPETIWRVGFLFFGPEKDQIQFGKEKSNG